ncbi:MAG: signal peptidase II [Lachnospiraceae bacterium]|jgi:signal peptidase II|nr:signal peptidase II [Lachnospiraceae bacterium]MBR7016739.1 signal peptidase II [Lachnospiraceae bacterium]MEE3378168.1 signal peptidase II [Lachnospiraceae bacterium]MEE3438308.1 signal peptidase II [Lachnospiraceae bacterium]
MGDILFSLWVFAIDFLFKRRAEEELPEGGEGRLVLADKIRYRRVQNTGMAGGLLKDKPELVRDGSTILLGGFLVYYVRLILEKGRMIRKLGAGLLLGGASSNLFDRWVRGSVTDYFSFNIKKVPVIGKLVFNLGDMAIFFGTILMGLTGRGDQ